MKDPTTESCDSQSQSPASLPSMSPSSRKVRSRRAALWILIPATILFLGSLLPAGIMIMLSPMAFDAGGTPATWTFVITLLAYPVVVVITLVAAWISFAKGCASQSQSPASLPSTSPSSRKVAPATAYRLAMWLTVVPFIHAFVLMVEMLVSG